MSEVKKVYHFHCVTKEFVNEDAAHVDLLESKIKGVTIYMLPSLATYTAPPAKVEKKAAIFNGSDWDVVDDYRKVEVFDKKTGHPVEKKLGEKLKKTESLTKPVKSAADIEYDKKNMQYHKNLQFLRETDFKLLGDYDKKPSDDLMEQRQLARIAARDFEKLDQRPDH
jgi:hypothetical protein